MSYLYVLITSKYKRFFSIPIESGEKLPEFDHTNYDVIVFDELGMANGHLLNKEEIIIGTADGKQLTPINDLTNVNNHEKYLNDCLNQIFNYKIYLNISKRLKTEEDKIKLSNIYNDIWIHKLPIPEIVEKYVEITDDIIASEHNVAYTSAKCKQVSNTVRNNLGKKCKYEVGEYLICREYKKEGKHTLNVNFKYEN